jgi:Arc/MetJ family transcription regulator
MSRTIIDLDDTLVAQAAKLFGTSTETATVNAALADAVNRAKRVTFTEWLAAGGLPDLASSAVMNQAWHGQDTTE